MRTRSIVIVIASAVVVASALFAHNPPTLTIKAAAKKQLPVPYGHEKHTKLVKSCDVCHHMQKGLTEEQATATNVVACHKCHLDPADASTPSMREMSLTKNPLHKLCIDCHKKAATKGPTVCGGCHRKGSEGA